MGLSSAKYPASLIGSQRIRKRYANKEYMSENRTSLPSTTTRSDMGQILEENRIEDFNNNNFINESLQIPKPQAARDHTGRRIIPLRPNTVGVPDSELPVRPISTVPVSASPNPGRVGPPESRKSKLNNRKTKMGMVLQKKIMD